MAKKRANAVLNYVKKQTKQLIDTGTITDQGGSDALNIALDLHIDRANVSKDLNYLWKNGSLIKIQGKPVYYLDYEILCSAYPDCYFPSVIHKAENIGDYFSSVKEENSKLSKNADYDFSADPIESIIGSSGSLSDLLLNARTAVTYPPDGINCLIYGNNGVGKSMLADRMHQLACKIKGTNVPYIHLFCQNYRENPALFTSALFGTPQKVGAKTVTSIFEQADHGIILLEQIENLPFSCQNMLSNIMGQKSFISAHTHKNIQLQCMIIATTSLDADSADIQSIVQLMPIRLHLLDIDQRGIYEKIELILEQFREEAMRIHSTIHVHKDIIACFASKQYTNNISQMHNEIQIACGRAYMDTSNTAKNTVYISYQHLSLEMLNMTENSAHNNAAIVSLLSCIPTDYLQFNPDGSSPSTTVFTNAPSVFNDHRLNQFVSEFDVDINNLDNMETYVNENISVLKDCPNAQLAALRKQINPFVYQVTMQKIQEHKEYGLLLSNYQLLYGIMLHITNYLKNLNQRALTESDNSAAVTEKIYPSEFILASDIFKVFEKLYDFVTPAREKDFLTSYIAVSSRWINHANVGILVICHGESIASQMIQYIKDNLSPEISIDSIDYTSNMQLNDCLELSCLKAISLNKGTGVLVACDMEPLTSIGTYIRKQTTIPTRTITSITLSQLITAANNSISAMNDLDSIINDPSQNQIPQKSDMPSNAFIEQVREKVIAKTSVFIDTRKAVEVLQICFSNTCKELSASETNTLMVKYICHCTNMLERVIKNETWDYQKLNQFIKTNYYIMHIVEHNLEYAESNFGIKIPSSEIAYITEIFIPESNIKSPTDFRIS